MTQAEGTHSTGHQGHRPTLTIFGNDRPGGSRLARRPKVGGRSISLRRPSGPLGRPGGDVGSARYPAGSGMMAQSWSPGQTWR